MEGSIAGIRPEVLLAGPLVRMEPLEERHREALREAAARGSGHLPVHGMAGDFDLWFDEALVAPGDVPFAVVDAIRGRTARHAS